MTHKDIYTKFMIEYDKASVTSSYPSLTEYEVATVLDKAYNALIAQKVTGNNVRRIGFEMDLKAIEDLAPLIKQKQAVNFSASANYIAPNVIKTEIPSDCLYFLDAYLKYTNALKETKSDKTKVLDSQCTFNFSDNSITPTENSTKVKVGYYLNKVDGAFQVLLKYDGPTEKFKYNTISLSDGSYSIGDTTEGTVDDIREALMSSDILVWSINDETGCKIEVYKYTRETITTELPFDGQTDRMVPVKLVTHSIASKFFTSAFNIPWIKVPVAYIEDNVLYIVYDLLNAPNKEMGTLVYIKKPHKFAKELKAPTGDRTYVTYFEGDGEDYTFECNETVAEELISLAVTFALENIESQRLTSKLNMRGLEA